MTTLSKSESKSIEKHKKAEEDEDGFDSYFYGKFVMCKDIFLVYFGEILAFD